MLSFSQSSESRIKVRFEMKPSPCWSLYRFGTTKATVGSLLKSEGKFLKGWLALAASWFGPGVAACQFDQGLCLRA